MAKGFLLGVDIGTYESKGVITTLEGEVVNIQVHPHTMQIPRQGWAEHDPEKDWWGDYCFLTKALLQATGINPKEILAVACSAIGPCMLPIDKEGNPLRMGVLYGVDTRATAEIAELEEKYGKKTLFEQTGNELSSQAVGPKILWLKHNEPDIYKKTYKIVTATTFMTGKLTGNYVMDHLTASFYNPLYDYKNCCWSTEYCEGIIEPERLPELGWGPDFIGKITHTAAEQTGLAEGTPVMAGTVDAAAEAVSVGVVSPGQMMLMYGSTIFMYIIQDKPVIDDRLWACRYVFDGTTANAAGMATSGALTRWFRDKLAPDLVQHEKQTGENAYGVLVKQADEIPAGSEGLVVLPYFSGERTPINDPRARGVYFGLTLSHTRAHLFRAALEGIAYGVNHHFEIMREHDAEPREIVAVGGGTKNQLWLQAVSDTCNVVQRVPAVTVGASYGDCFLAGMGAGVFHTYHDIKQWMNYVKTVTPDAQNHLVYEKYYKIYRALYERNKELMHQLYDLV
jgi:xylulokinase